MRVTNDDGKVTEYVEMDSGIRPRAASIPPQLEQMDCITCHNRITHLVNPPEDVVDHFMERGIISPDIPEIRNKAVEVYSQPYPSVEMGSQRYCRSGELLQHLLS